MPFQSEKQRRYLWANEPEIARDWADTYGSRIEKNTGGISQLVKSGPGRPGYGGPHETYDTGKSYEKATSSGGGGGNAWQQQALQQHKQEQQAKGEGAKQQKYEAAAKQYKEKKTLGDKFKLKSSDYRKKELRKLFDYIYGGRKKQFPSWGAITRKADWDDEDYLEFANMSPMEFQARLGTDFSMEDIDKLREIGQALGQDNLSQTGKFKGDNKFAFEDFYPNMNQQSAGGGGGDGQRGGYMGYPSYEAWKAAQGTGATAAVAPQLSAFQQSLTAGANNPFDYYVGTTPGAKNLAWGKQMGVDPRTMGLTSFAADGGRIGRAYGGIMDTATGRRAYGFGSIFKKIGRAAKKVFKSPIGKAALLGGAAYGANQMGWFGKDSFLAPLLRKNIAAKGMPAKWGGYSLGKLGILGASALPFFMGGEEEEDEGFNYNAVRDKYADELMRIKAGAQAGTLDPNKFVYYDKGGRVGLEAGGDPLLREEYDKYVFEMEEMGMQPMTFEEFAAQARAGMYAGGQSTPSDYTMEDAMMTTTQDKLGGITDVMKQADLNRQGSVGQFYAADGGQICLPKKSYPWPKEERATAQEGGLMDLGGMEKDYRNDGGFVPIGEYEKKDDVPARLSKNEFVFTADAVRGAGGGDIDKGAEIMENVMKNLEQGGQISEDTQGLGGAQEMFSVSERLSEVV